MPPPLTLAFVMDPIESIDIDADSTFVLMLEAQDRGHQLLVIDPVDLAVSEGRVVAMVRPVRVRREPGRHAELGQPRGVAAQGPAGGRGIRRRYPDPDAL